MWCNSRHLNRMQNANLRHWVYLLLANVIAMANSTMIEEIVREVSKVNFNSRKFRKMYEQIEKENKELLEKAKPDWETMHKTFDV